MEDIKKIQEFFSKPMGESQSEDKEEILKKSIISAQEVLKRFDNDFEKGYVRMHIHDYNIRRNHLLDNLLLARQRLSDFKKLNEAESEAKIEYLNPGKRPIITNKQGEKFVLQGFATSGYYLIPYNGEKYWEHFSVPKNQWISEKNINWNDYNFSEEQFNNLKASNLDSKKEIDKKFQDMNEVKSEDPVDTITMDVPLFIRMLEYSREDAQEDMDLHDVAEKAILLNKEKGILSMEDYNEIVGGVEDINENKDIKVGDIVSKKFASTEEDYTKEFKVTGITGMKADLQDTKTGKNTKISLSDLSKVVPMKSKTKELAEAVFNKLKK